MNIKITSHFIFILCLLLFSCSSSGEKNTKSDSPLAGTKWVLKVLNDKKVSPPDSTKSPFIILSKDDSKLNGNGGCNTIFSSYTLDGDKLKFGPIASTEMYCDQMETETEFTKALSNIVRYKINGTNLTLYNSDKVAAKLEAANRN